MGKLRCALVLLLIGCDGRATVPYGEPSGNGEGTLPDTRPAPTMAVDASTGADAGADRAPYCYVRVPDAGGAYEVYPLSDARVSCATDGCPEISTCCVDGDCDGRVTRACSCPAGAKDCLVSSGCEGYSTGINKPVCIGRPGQTYVCLPF